MTQRILAATALVASLASSVALAQSAQDWEIGPIIRGKNYSLGMPLTLEPTRAGPAFDFPSAGSGHVHYVTLPSRPIAGASRIVMRYRIDASRSTRFVAQQHPDQPATVSLFFQRAGDSWSGKRHEYHRWYAPDASMRRVVPGEYQITVSLSDPGWVSVFGKTASTNPQMFDAALAQTIRVGFVLGSAWGRGHGVYATAPARFTLLDFRVI